VCDLFWDGWRKSRVFLRCWREKETAERRSSLSHLYLLDISFHSVWRIVIIEHVKYKLNMDKRSRHENAQLQTQYAKHTWHQCLRCWHRKNSDLSRPFGVSSSFRRFRLLHFRRRKRIHHLLERYYTVRRRRFSAGPNGRSVGRVRRVDEHTVPVTCLRLFGEIRSFSILSRVYTKRTIL